MTMLFDSHAHLDASKFDHDRELVISRAKSSGVQWIMNPGADLESSMAAVDLAASHDFIFAAVGVHPHSASTMDMAMLAMIKNMAKKPKVKAIGEIGLDYHYDFSPRDIQKHWFIEQLRLARELSMPVIIHDREANQDVMDILKQERAFDSGVLLHCYSGSAELAKQYVHLGAYISIAGPVTFSNNKKTAEVVRCVPLDRLMVETDAPYLTPEPYRGKRNEPMYVEKTCVRVAELKGISLDEAAKATCDNAKRFFGIE